MGSLPRKSTVNKFKKLRSEILKQGGDIGDKTNTKAEMRLPNSLWIDDPFDRSIDTINNYVELETEAALPRRSTVKQFKDFVGKSGNDIGKKTTPKATGNLLKSKKKIDTINQHVKLEIESFTEFIKESLPPSLLRGKKVCTISEDDIFQVKMYSCICPNCGCDSNLCDDKQGFNGMNCEECGCEFELK